MLELIKKTMLTGIGLTVVTKEKVEDLARGLVEKGELTKKEGKEFIDSILKKSEQAKKDLDNKIENVVNKVLGNVNVATKADIERLEKKIDGNE